MSINQSRITLKSVKYFAAGSEETPCFVASVQLDGLTFASAQNDGHGGCTNIIPLPLDAARAEMERAEAFAKTLPPDVTDWDDPKTPGKKFEIPMDLEHVVDSLLSDYLTDQDMRRSFLRAVKSKVLFIEDGSVFTIKYDPKRLPFDKVVDVVRRRHGESVTILNLMDQTQAIALYKATMLDQQAVAS